MTRNRSLERLLAGCDQSGGPDACWPWVRSTRGEGYGATSYHGRSYLAHRLMWELTNGPVPEGLWVCHRCDNRSCVNARHLFLGTSQDNVSDMMRKGRQRWQPREGEAHPRAKLTADIVREIRRRYAAGEASQRVLAREYGVASAQIHKAIHRQAWRSVD